MGLPDLELPHRTSFDFGIGVEASSGSPRNFAVEGVADGVHRALGVATRGFSVSRVSSSRELQDKLGVDLSASYGVGTFGAGASGRFSFTEDSKVQTSSLFMSVACDIRLADLSIDHPKLVDEAAGFVDQPEVLAEQYGNMFLRGCNRGGLYIGVLQIDTKDEEQKSQIEAELKGTYGLFSADVSSNFSTIAKRHDAAVYCSMYTEGGPEFDALHPEDPNALLNYANTWFKAFQRDSDGNAVPYKWYLSPLTVASAPAPPNSVELIHAQDVLRFCAQERLSLLDDLNLLTQMSNQQQLFDWSQSVSKEEVADAAKSVQSDLDLVSDCASHAMTEVAAAEMPAGFAVRKSRKYRTKPLPSPLPVLVRNRLAPPGTPGKPLDPGLVIVPDWQPGDSPNLATNGGTRINQDGCFYGDYVPSGEEVGLKVELAYDPPGGGGPFVIQSVSPSAGSPVPRGGIVVVTCGIGVSIPCG